MAALTPWFYIFLAVLAYFIFAVAASFMARALHIDMKEMAGRTSPKLLLVGIIANLAVLILILLMVRFLNDRSIAALGLTFGIRDLVFSISAAAGTFLLAVLFVWLLKLAKRFEVIYQKPAHGARSVTNMLGGLVVLFVVALQEEVLFRGYVSLNLAGFGPVFVLLVSTLIFVAIHFLTNRINLHQIVSWTISGLVLAAVYLITGSIWVPVILHFAIDATNVLVFNITGQFSLFNISPALVEKDRTVYRVVHGIAVLAPALVVFGSVFRLP